MIRTKDNQFYGKVKTCKCSEWISDNNDGFYENISIIWYDECGRIINVENNGVKECDQYIYNTKGLLISHISKYETQEYIYRPDGKLVELLSYTNNGILKSRKIYGEFGLKNS